MTTVSNQVLCLKVLSADQRKLAERLGLDVIEASALGVEFLEAGEIEGLDALPQKSARWVFTSRKAVKSVARLLQEKVIARPKHLEVFAVGAKTAEAIDKMLQMEAVIPEEATGSGLGRLLVEQTTAQSAPLIYWRGNRSTGQLQDIVAENDIPLTQIQVYRTEIQALDLPESDYRGVIFVSPSSAEAYHRSGGFDGSRKHWFAIGPTTAAALRDYLPESDRIHQPDDISLEELLFKVAEVLGTSGEESE
jgi:uroporphyrinogen-III synthase